MPKTTSFPLNNTYWNIFWSILEHFVNRFTIFYSVFCDKLDKTCSNCYYYTSCILSLMKLLIVVACTKIDAEKQPCLCIKDAFIEGEKQKLN